MAVSLAFEVPQPPGPVVPGKNLRKVVAAWQAGTASFLQEYDPDEWPERPKGREPVIEQINDVFHDARVAAAGAETQKKAGKLPRKTISAANAALPFPSFSPARLPES